MSNVDTVDLEHKVHQWCNKISRAAIPHTWAFGVGSNGLTTEYWPGVALNNVVRDKILDIILQDTDTSYKMRIEIMDEVCDYIAAVVYEKNFPDRVLETTEGGQMLSLDKLAAYVGDVYSVQYHDRLQIGSKISQRLNKEAQPTVKNKM